MDINSAVWKKFGEALKDIQKAYSDSIPTGQWMAMSLEFKIEKGGSVFICGPDVRWRNHDGS